MKTPKFLLLIPMIILVALGSMAGCGGENADGVAQILFHEALILPERARRSHIRVGLLARLQDPRKTGREAVRLRGEGRKVSLPLRLGASLRTADPSCVLRKDLA